MNHSGHHPSGWVHINHPDMIENFIDRNKDGEPDGGYRGILSLIDAIETENYRTAQILHPAPYKITRLAGRKELILCVNLYGYKCSTVDFKLGVLL